MQDKMIEKLDSEIRALQRSLAQIGPMRPGTLSEQYHHPAQKQGGYWQLSYTFHQRSHTEHVRPEELAEVRAQVEQYQQFKQLCARWIDLALKRARRQRQLSRRKPRPSVPAK